MSSPPKLKPQKVFTASVPASAEAVSDYGFPFFFRRLLTPVPALCSGHSHAQHLGPGKRVIATPTCRHSPLVHKCTLFPPPSRPRGVHKHAGVLGSRRNPRSYQLPDKGSFRRQMGTHRKNDCTSSCQHHSDGASPREHFLFRRYLRFGFCQERR